MNDVGLTEKKRIQDGRRIPRKKLASENAKCGVESERKDRCKTLYEVMLAFVRARTRQEKQWIEEHSTTRL